MKCWLELVNFVVHVDMNYSSLLCICAICMVHSMPFTSNSYWFQIFFLYKRWQIHWPFIPEICYWTVLWELCFSQTNVLVVCTLLKLEQPLIILSVHTNIVIHKFLVSNASWQHEIHSFPQKQDQEQTEKHSLMEYIAIYLSKNIYMTATCTIQRCCNSKPSTTVSIEYSRFIHYQWQKKLYNANSVAIATL